MAVDDPFETAPNIVPPGSPVEVETLAKKTKQGQEQETIGQRLARLRLERGLTQVELAEKLGLAQPHISDYEHDSVRLNGQVIIELTRILRVSADQLLGLEEPKGNATIKNRRLLRRLQDLDQLPKRDQQALLRTIDAFVAKAS